MWHFGRFLIMAGTTFSFSIRRVVASFLISSWDDMSEISFPRLATFHTHERLCFFGHFPVEPLDLAFAPGVVPFFGFGVAEALLQLWCSAQVCRGRTSDPSLKERRYPKRILSTRCSRLTPGLISTARSVAGVGLGNVALDAQRL